MTENWYEEFIQSKGLMKENNYKIGVMERYTFAENMLR